MNQAVCLPTVPLRLYFTNNIPLGEKDWDLWKQIYHLDKRLENNQQSNSSLSLGVKFL